MNEPYDYPQPAFPVEWTRERDLYFYQQEILGYDDSYVNVKNHGNMLMFGSYSYLGLVGNQRIESAAKAAIDKYGTGTHGVRLLAGTTPLHIELEEKLAEFKGAEAAAVFSSGYAANISTISALATRHDYIFCDKLNHASIVDGCKLSDAKIKRFRHNDINHLDALLSSAPKNANKLVIVDAVFSMDGDIIDLPRLTQVCKKHNALLMADEAHSLGVIGKTGRGIEEHFNLASDCVDIKMGTLSKTIPSVGGYIAGKREVIDLIKNRGRGFIYSAALPPSCAAAALEAIKVIEDESWRVEKLQSNAAFFNTGMTDRGFYTFNSQTAVVPILIGDSEEGFYIAKSCQDKGLFVQCIPSPVVPKGTERLRCIVTTSHTESELASAMDIISDSIREYDSSIESTSQYTNEEAISA